MLQVPKLNIYIRVLASTRWAQNEEKYENLPSTIIYELAHLKNRRFLRSCDVILGAIELKLNILHHCIMPQNFWKFYLFMMFRLWVIARNVQKHPFFRDHIYHSLYQFVLHFMRSAGNLAYIHAKDMVDPLLKPKCPPVCHRIDCFLLF